MNCRRFAGLLYILMLGAAPNAPAAETPRGWIEDGNAALREALSAVPETGRARNVILFVGDGMSIPTVTAARILDGQLRGGPGEDNVLSFEHFPYTGLVKTYNTDYQVPDSAGTMSAMMTGVKTRMGVLSVDQSVTVGDCASGQGHERETFLELMAGDGRATGIVTTAAITDATPAATYAHSPDREWESDSDMPDTARRAGCRDIARQLVEFPRRIDVILGGGRRAFMPSATADPEYPQQRGARADGVDLIALWLRRNPDGIYLWNVNQFHALDPAHPHPVLGLFEPGAMRYAVDRAGDAGGEPSLADMTSMAISLLADNERGYFLMVEGGLIDKAHHLGNAYRALHETRELADAVAVAVERTRRSDTLIVVTADHSHMFMLGGYPTRGNPVLGKVIENDYGGTPLTTPALAADGLPYTTLGYYNGPGAGRRNLTGVDTADPEFRQEAAVPLEDESHGGDDVALYAAGPWAHLFSGVHEQNYVYHVLRHAAGFPPAVP